MKKKIISCFLAILLMSCGATVFAYSSSEVNQRLESCTPTKNLTSGGLTTYQVTGMMGSVCVFRIQTKGGNKPDLICKVPPSRMREITSYNPITVQNVKNKYCVMSLKGLK